MSTVTRFARQLGFGVNSLRRPVDRVESFLLVLSILTAIAVAMGGVFFGSTLAKYEVSAAFDQLSSRRAMTAVLLENSAQVGLSTGALDGLALARWIDTQGNQHVGQISTAPGQKAGTSVQIWVDPTGKAVSAPMGSTDAIACAVTIAAAMTLTAETLLLGLFWLLRWPLDRWRDKAWDQDWKQASRKWKQGLV